MNSQDEQFIPYADNTLVRLKTAVAGRKFSNGGREGVDHTLNAGDIVSIRKTVPLNTRTSINTSPLTCGDYVFQLQATLPEDFIHDGIEARVFQGIQELQKIAHLALVTDEDRKPNTEVFKMGEKARILSGKVFNYGHTANAATLRGGDLVYICTAATTKTGGPTRNPQKAYYLRVQKIKRTVRQRGVLWRSLNAVPAGNFELVQN